MRLRLNMWQRLGLVASVIWPIYAYFSDMGRQTKGLGELAFGPCVRAGNPDITCGQSLYETLWREAMWNSVLAALLPIPLIWLLAYVVIWTLRWIWAGRETA